MSRRVAIAIFIACFAMNTALASDPVELQRLLEREIVPASRALEEIQVYCESRLPPMPMVQKGAEWEKHAKRIRDEVLDRVVYRGEAARWRDSEAKVEWLETIEGGPGYRIRKLRYEALPGMWIPALLYEPEKLEGKVPVVLNVNGHDGNGKAAVYKQIRCINQAKRGMLALNPEWFGMGQLNGQDYRHSRMNQIDLCGTSGLAPFYLAMKRGLDVLLAHEHADAKRVAVAGLSGGGWQTITISSLDTRVTLSNPVAGYSSFRTRVRNFSDLGDAEQTPCDLGTVADYEHLTALLAPRPALLTYNVKDECCFAAAHALPPLLDAARPIYKLFGNELNLRSHVNHHPGTHNFDRENREALYRMFGDFFFADQKNYDSQEIASDGEVKTKEQLQVELPEGNASFHSLAAGLRAKLPLADVPSQPTAGWQASRRETLREIVRARSYDVREEAVGNEQKGNVVASFWRLQLSDAWTVPAVELVRGEPKGTSIVVADGGRKTAAAQIETLLSAGQRVIAVDPFYMGELKPQHRDYLFALLVTTVGDRPIGLQASQLGAVARWAHRRHGHAATLVAVGSRSTTASLVAAAIEERSVQGVELHQSLASLKEVIEKNMTYEQAPELFCFGLLAEFDIKHLAALVAPRPVVVR